MTTKFLRISRLISSTCPTVVLWSVLTCLHSNRLSLTGVALAFDGLAVEGSNAAAVPGESAKAIAKEAERGDEPEIVEVTGPSEMEDHSCLRSAFVQALSKWLGITQSCRCLC